MTATPDPNTLVEAARNGDMNAVQAALDAGVPINMENELGEFALMEAANYGEPEMVRFLIESGADVYSNNGDEHIALHYAAKEGADTIVQILLDAGSFVDHENCNGRTPLMEACRCRNESTVRLLLTEGAAVDGQDRDDWTPLMYAVNPTMSGGGQATPEGAVVRALLEAGVPLDTPNNEGQTALHIAARNGAVEGVEELLSAGADTTLVDRMGRTAEDVATGEARSLLTAHRERPILDRAAGLTDDRESVQRSRTM